MRVAYVVLLLVGCGSSLPTSSGSTDAAVSRTSGDGGTVAKTPTSVLLHTPTAFESLVDPAAPIVFAVSAEDPVWPAIQTAITLAIHGTTTRISGAFTHDTSGLLTLAPATALPTSEDIVASVHACVTCAVVDGTTVGFSTGSHPRVASIVLVSKDGQSLAYVGVRFSEPMDATTVRTALSLASGGPVTGQVTQMGASTFDFTPGSTIAKSSTVTLTIGAAMGASGTAFDPASWDSPTAVGGQFQLALSLADTTLTSCGIDCVEWAPSVNVP